MLLLKTYFLATRPQFLPAVVMPVLLGASTAWQVDGAFYPFRLALSLFAALAFHAGMNVLNDYFDHLNGADALNESPLTPFTGGSRFIQNRLMTPGETLALGSSLVAFGSLIGLYLAYLAGWGLLFIGGAGLFIGLFYSAPPLFFAGRGLGEAAVGISFGLLTVTGAFFVQTGRFAIEPVFASLPPSFLISALLYINEFPDFEADRRAGKRTLVVRLGPERARFYIWVFVVGPALAIIAGVLGGYLPTASLVALGALIPAVAAAMRLSKDYSGGAKLKPAIKAVITAHLLSGALLIAAGLV